MGTRYKLSKKRMQLNSRIQTAVLDEASKDLLAFKKTFLDSDECQMLLDLKVLNVEEAVNLALKAWRAGRVVGQKDLKIHQQLSDELITIKEEWKQRALSAEKSLKALELEVRNGEAAC